MTDAWNTSTSHADMIPETWADGIQLAYDNVTINGAIAAAFNATAQMGDGDTLNLPRQSPLAFENRVEGTANDRKLYSASTRTLAITAHKGVVISITDFARAMAKYELAAPYMEDAGYESAQQLDAAICQLYSSAGLTVTGTTGSNITEAMIREAKRKLDNAKAPRMGRWILLNSTQEDAVSAIDGFRRYDALGANGGGDPIRTGRPIGTIHGFQVLTSQNIVATTDGFAHNLAGVSGGSYQNSSIAFATKPWAPMLSNTRNITINNLGLRATFTYNITQAAEDMSFQQNYGVAAPRSEWLVDIKTTDNA